MIRRVFALAALCTTVLASAAPAFEREWPIDARGTDGVYRIRLPAEVYPHVARADLGDLVVWNDRHEAVPFGPIAEAIPAAAPPVPVMREIPWFRLPRAQGGAPEDSIRLHIMRDADGRLRQLDAEVEPSGAAPVVDLLLDAGAIEHPISALEVLLDPASAADFSARVDLLASSDLTQWQVLATEQPLLSLRQGEFRLDRRRIDIADQRVRYLLLHRTDADDALPVDGVAAWTWDGGRLPEAPERPTLPLGPGRVTDQAGVFEFDGAGPLKVERIEVALADPNAIADVIVSVRDHPTLPWTEHRRLTAFRVEAGGQSVQSQPVDIVATRARQWRIATLPPQPRPPSLTLTWRREDFVFVAQGQGPFRLMTGDPKTLRPTYPLQTLLSAVRGSLGRDWEPGRAELGPARAATLPAAAPPPPPPADRRWLLWSALVGGALIVVGLVLRLLKDPTSGGGRASP